MEVLVVVVIATIIAVVLVPQVLSRLNTGGAAALAQNLSGIAKSLQEYRADVGRYPSRLAYLAAPPPSGATDTCGRTLPPQNIAGWNGPYLDREVGSSGIVTGSATINNDIVRVPQTYSQTGTLFLQATDVDRAVVDELEAAFDGDEDFATGVIRWAEVGGQGVGVLTYAIPIRAC